MLLGVETYGSSLLEALGHGNVVGPGERYPVTTLEELVRLEPEIVLLPSEPYVFGPRHQAEVAAALTGADVRLVDGRDLFWWGIRTPVAARRVHAALG
jgi:ABC-type hemin transport system substrate-binding protein